MLVIGLVGGVASGKSLVAAEFVRLGAAVLDGDRAGHDVLRLPEVRDQLVARWGPGILGADGEVARPAVAAKVFGTTDEARAERAFLEGVTHPRIGQLLLERLQAIGRAKPPAVVLDAPLMLEAGWDRFCDQIVFVDAPAHQRLQRALGRGWRAEDFAAREAAQESLDRKRARADVVIDNSGSPAETGRQIQQIWQTWRPN